ncbi:hypothetical protein LZY01_18750 [Levilactobacillus zymae]|uniref:Mobile element protein n=1 Tax=Levilactobacillus zymae TaxID=267363 RepID=A0ABQ0WZ57_9LACO|nr:hypothetical protein [Levilactobacillus zymae]GEO72707.1 hypothetical protein LZY01_18750 [Levilactobacillus zymae]
MLSFYSYSQLIFSALLPYPELVSWTKTPQDSVTPHDNDINN